MKYLFKVEVRNSLKHIVMCLNFVVVLLTSMNAQAVSFDLISSSPVGSWQLREDLDTNRKGKETLNRIRTSMVGKEQRNGQDHYWIEVHLETFKIKKNGDRKATGKPSIMKSLVPASTLKGDPENAISNLRTFGVETIIQTGNQSPIKMSNSGGLIAGAMKAANVELKQKFQDIGNEEVTVQAGTFSTRKLSGTGEVSANAVFKKINIKSNTTTWISNKVPFGLVKSEGDTITNGKTSTQQSELLEFGLYGAKSMIIKEPQEMPSIKGIFGG